MPNPICHFELMVPEPEKAQAFYGKVFDWKFTLDQALDYTLIDTGGQPGGGLMATPPGTPVRAALNVYVLVESIEATLGKVEAAGGCILVPKTPIPGHGSFAWFSDPDGVAVGVFQEAPA